MSGWVWGRKQSCCSRWAAVVDLIETPSHAARVAASIVCQSLLLGELQVLRHIVLQLGPFVLLQIQLLTMLLRRRKVVCCGWSCCRDVGIEGRIVVGGGQHRRGSDRRIHKVVDRLIDVQQGRAWWNRSLKTSKIFEYTSNYLICNFWVIMLDPRLRETYQ